MFLGGILAIGILIAGTDQRIEDIKDLGFGQTELMTSGDGQLGELAKLPLALLERDVDGSFRNPHPLAADPLDDPFGFEPGIGLADGHWVDGRRPGQAINPLFAASWATFA